LQIQLIRSQFQRPLHLHSGETSDGVSGDIYVRIDYPYTSTDSAAWWNAMPCATTSPSTPFSAPYPHRPGAPRPASARVVRGDRALSAPIA